MIVGVSGSSGSGKTSICEQIKLQVVNKTITVIPLDSFYKGISQDVNPKDYNFDHPNAFDIEECIKVVQMLKMGKAIDIPIYDYVIHQRKSERKLIEPADIIIIEGIFVFYWKELRDLMDLKIYMMTDMDHCLIRRTMRDIKERGRTVQQVFDQYIKYVKPAYKEFIKETRQYANIILPNNTDFLIGMKCICDRLQSI